MFMQFRDRSQSKNNCVICTQIEKHNMTRMPEAPLEKGTFSSVDIFC